MSIHCCLRERVGLLTVPRVRRAYLGPTDRTGQYTRLPLLLSPQPLNDVRILELMPAWQCYYDVTQFIRFVRYAALAESGCGRLLIESRSD